MTTRAAALCLVALSSCLGAGAIGIAQSSMQPTPPPEITADTRDWYTSGAPISFGGNVYHQAGPVIHFLRNEMVLTGMFDGVPIYVRTTQEPGSIIYVPLPGGVMRPYERRRSGELAGTVGSTVPSFPVVLPTAQSAHTTPAYVQAPLDTITETVGTSGFIMSGPDTGMRDAPAVHAPGHRALQYTPPSSPLAPLRSARQPAGLNDAFVDYAARRWFLAGPAVEYRPGRFAKIGEYHGFPVFAEEGGGGDVIFVPPIPGSPGLLTPYRAR